MTGRAAGHCAGFPAPGYANPYGRGLGRGGGTTAIGFMSCTSCTKSHLLATPHHTVGFYHHPATEAGRTFPNKPEIHRFVAMAHALVWPFVVWGA